MCSCSQLVLIEAPNHVTNARPPRLLKKKTVMEWILEKQASSLLVLRWVLLLFHCCLICPSLIRSLLLKKLVVD